MKRLNKLQINSEKIMKNEEMMTLRGGYDFCLCFCLTVGGSPLGSVLAATGTCVSECQLAFGISATGYCT